MQGTGGVGICVIMIKKLNYIVIYSLPFLLLLTTYYAFHLFRQIFEEKTAYFLGFVFYWLFWCIAVPLYILGTKSLTELLKARPPIFGKHKIRNIAFLVLPLIIVYCYEFPKVFIHTNFLIIVCSLGLSFINAIAEEILWRGTFLKLMGDNSKWYILFSSFGFALWHFAPLSIIGNQNPGGSLSFVAISFLLGLTYSTVSKDNKSILLTVVSHILFDFSGLGARIYF